MTIEIDLPDGSVAEFPDGTPPEVMKGALQKRFAAKVNPATNQPGDVPAFNPGVPGYDPQSGEVQKYGMGGSAGMGAADMTTFGFGDEAAAGLGTLIDKLPGGQGASFGQNLAEIRGNQGQAKQDNPKSYLAGQVAGGVAQGLVAGPGVMANAPSLAGRVAGGALTGGGMGGLYGIGSGEGTQDRLVKGGVGLGTGALVGGAFPVLGAWASGQYRSIANALNGNAAARTAGTTPDVLRMLGTVMDADGTLGPQGQANIAAAGPDAMLADAGPNARSILDTSIQRGGPGGAAARDAIAARTARGSQAINTALDTSLGAPEGVTLARSAIREGSAPARTAAYEAAYAAPIDYAAPEGRAIEEMVRTRVPHAAITAANNLMRTEGNQSAQIMARVADDGSVVFERMPDVRQLDYITRGLNEVAEQAHGSGRLGGTTATGRAYEGLSRELRNNLRTLVPEYGTALETAADPIRRSAAVDLGSRIFSPAMTRDQIAEATHGMTGPEMDAVAQGARSRLDDVMANVTRTAADGDTAPREALKALKEMSSRANREKLATALGLDRVRPLFDEMDRVARTFELRASVAENSKTFARQATEARIAQMTEPGAIGQALQGKPLKAGQRIAQALTGQTPERITANQNAIYSQLAEVLTRPAGQAQPIFNALQGLGQNDQATRLMAERISRALSGRGLAYPSSTLLQNKLQGR